MTARALTCLATLALLAAGCSLIVDVDGVRRSRDAGAAGGGGGATDGGGGTAGGGGAAGTGGTGGGGMTDAGSDAGAADAGQPYDGGTRCTSSPRPRLRCDAPTSLAASAASWPNLVPTPNGLLAALRVGTEVRLLRVSRDGGSEPALTIPAAAVYFLTLATEGAEWALAFQPTSGGALTCWSSRDDGGVVLGSPTTDGLGISVASSGEVAVAVGRGWDGGDDFRLGLSSSGCPRSLVDMATPFGDWSHAGITHVPGTGVEGFRVVGAGSFNFCNGLVAMTALASDGGLRTPSSMPASGWCPGEVQPIVSSDGQQILIASGDGTSSDDYMANLRAFPTDLSAPVEQSLTAMVNAYQWSAGNCGPGCAALVTAPSSNTPAPLPHLAVTLISDDGNLTPLGADAGWDVRCGVLRDDTQAAVAWDDGRLVFLVTSPTAAELIRCDRPPF